MITSHPEHSLFEARFSPDDRWVCFQATKAGAQAVVYVVSSSGGDWTKITEDNVWSDKPHWSPDGKTIYYISNRGTAFFNVWGIRFDPARGKPVGRVVPRHVLRQSRQDGVAQLCGRDSSQYGSLPRADHRSDRKYLGAGQCRPVGSSNALSDAGPPRGPSRSSTG